MSGEQWIPGRCPEAGDRVRFADALAIVTTALGKHFNCYVDTYTLPRVQIPPRNASQEHLRQFWDSIS